MRIWTFPRPSFQLTEISFPLQSVHCSNSTPQCFRLHFRDSSTTGIRLLHILPVQQYILVTSFLTNSPFVLPSSGSSQVNWNVLLLSFTCRHAWRFEQYVLVLTILKSQSCRDLCNDIHEFEDICWVSQVRNFLISVILHIQLLQERNWHGTLEVSSGLSKLKLICWLFKQSTLFFTAMTIHRFQAWLQLWSIQPHLQPPVTYPAVFILTVRPSELNVPWICSLPRMHPLMELSFLFHTLKASKATTC